MFVLENHLIQIRRIRIAINVFEVMFHRTDSKLTPEENKLLNEALSVLKSAHVDLINLSLTYNDCLWLAFTQPPYQLSIQSVSLLRQKFSRQQSETTYVDMASIPSAVDKKCSFKKRKIMGN